AGADLGVVESQLSGLGVPFEITFSTVQRCGLRACKVDVRDAPAGASVMRTYADALALLEGAALDPAVASRAASIFGRLARAEEAELVTPTGAAILAEYASSFGQMPPMTVGAVGYGAGSRELEIPNVLRVVVGEPGPPGPVGVEDVLVEATIDDMNPELYPF